MVSRAFALFSLSRTLEDTDTLPQFIVKHQGSVCLCVGNSQRKTWCLVILSFIHTHSEYHCFNGNKVGFYRASAGSNQTFFSFFSPVQQPPSLPCSSPTDILSLKLLCQPGWKQSSSGHMGFHRQSLHLSVATLQAQKLLRDYRYPFLCLFSLEIFAHTKEPKWNASPLSEPTLFAPVPLYGLSLLGRVGFFHPQYPKEHMVIKTINAAFFRPFYWL